MSNSSLIAKNTLALYFRMLLMMFVTFYTSRLLLNILGIVDFGVYSIINGIILIFSFVNTALTSSTQRFLSFEIGKNDSNSVNLVFNASFRIYILIILIGVIIFETVGLWYLNNKLNIPDDKVYVSNVIFQISILSFALLTLRIPFNSLILSNEKMSFYAYISVLEALLALLVIFFIKRASFDKLILYSSLLTIVQLLILIFYYVFCRLKFITSKLTITKVNKEIYKSIIGFSGWTIIGSFSIVGAQQGVNLILNFFHGVVINTSVGIANQLSMGLYNLVSNVQIAFNPQIIKSYSSDNFKEFISIIFKNSKYCFFLFLFIFIPLFLQTDSIIKIWLGTTPIYTIEFTKLILLYLLIETISYPLGIGIQAIGKIKKYQIVLSVIFILNIPISYFLLSIGYNPIIVFVVKFILNIILLFFRLFYFKSVFNYSIKSFLNSVVYTSFKVFGISFGTLFIINYLYQGQYKLIFILLMSSIITLLTIYMLGLTLNEKKYMKNFIFKMFSSKIKS